MTRPRRGRSKPVRSPATRQAPRRRTAVPGHVVALVGSAGALDALERFFGQLPADVDAAFVVALHRERGSRGLLAEVLSRFTPMPVVALTRGLLVAARTVYVLPTDRVVSMREGRLVVGPPDHEPLTLDEVLRMVAADQKERAIGVLFSGMNADGTLGLEDLRAQGGRAFVQDPATADYATMPESAVTAGVADAIGSPETLAQLLTSLPIDAVPPVDRVLTALARHTGHTLAHYKRSTLTRRIERRMGLLQLPDLAQYAATVERDPAEARALLADLLIGVTGFFRDPEAFEALRAVALPALLRSTPRDQPLRVWVAGCASGEEAYSIAMLLQEAIEGLSPLHHVAVQIYATDLDEAAIARARVGRYSAASVGPVSTERLARWFRPEEDGSYRIKREIREMVVFAPQDLTADPPFTRLDLLSCRNVLIYLDAEAQKKLLALFAFALRPGGFLLLGSSESLAGAGRAFDVVDAKNRLFCRREIARDHAPLLEFPLGTGRGAVSGWLHDAVMSSAPRSPLGTRESIREIVQVALEEIGAARKGPRARGKTAARNPSRAEARILALTDELESFRREVQVTYEELQSANEELKSTNEELVTTREETQAMNEELLTLNAELESKNESLEVTNDDMRNLLSSSQIPTLFLDNQLRLKRFTTQATRVANLIPSDVGRPITDIVLNVRYDDLARDVRRVLDTLVFVEARVNGNDGSVFTMRIHPYRTAQNVIDGVVLTFLDVTALLTEARKLRDEALQRIAVALLAQWPGLGYVFDAANDRTVAVSPETVRVLDYAPEVLAGATAELWRSLHHPDDRAAAVPGAVRTCRLRARRGGYVIVLEERVDLAALGIDGSLQLVKLTPEPAKSS